MVVHGADDVALACRPGLRLVLLSAPGAAGFGGGAWWRAVVAAAPDAALIADDILDCADAAGRVLQALDAGCRSLVVTLPPGPQRLALEQIAARHGARLLRGRPAALDLAVPGALHRLPGWLSGG